VAAGFFAVAIQAVIAGQTVGDIEPGDPPTVVPVQAGNVSVGIIEGADVKFDSPGVAFLALNGQRGSALVAERPPHPRRGLVDLAFPFRKPDLVGKDLDPEKVCTEIPNCWLKRAVGACQCPQVREPAICRVVQGFS